jgi:uncharacterized protein YndB with AHSA1/START domain
METMQQPTVNHSTFTLERSFPASPERVFSAFSDPAKKIRWYADGRTMEVLEFSMDFRVGGHDCTRYQTPQESPLQGVVLRYDTHYLEIEPSRRIVIAYTIGRETADENRPFSASLATFELLPSDTGTDLLFTEQAAFFENSDGPEWRKQGWTSLLNKLAEALSGALAD